MKDYYSILGVDKTASQEEIKKSYRRLAAKWHPDKNSSDEAKGKFQEINEAYQTLGDENARRAYDQGGFAGHGFNVHDDVDLRDIFSHFFRQQSARQRVVTVPLTLKEAYLGKTVAFDGDTFTIDPGARDGDVFRGKNVYQIRLRREENRQVDDDGNIFMTCKIDAFQAMLGTEVIVNVPDGTKINVKIPAGVQNGQGIRVNGKGIPANPTRGVHSPGSIYLVVDVFVPRDLTDDLKAAILQGYNSSTVEI